MSPAQMTRVAWGSVATTILVGALLAAGVAAQSTSPAPGSASPGPAASGLTSPAPSASTCPTPAAAPSVQPTTIPSPAPSGGTPTSSLAPAPASPSVIPPAGDDPCLAANLAGIAAAWQPLIDQLAKDTIAINKRINAEPSFAALRADFRRYHDLQKRYDDAVYALPWPAQLRPQIDAWKAVHDDRLALLDKLSHVRTNKELGQLYAKDDAFASKLKAVANPLLSAVGLPTQ